MQKQQYFAWGSRNISIFCCYFPNFVNNASSAHKKSFSAAFSMKYFHFSIDLRIEQFMFDVTDRKAILKQSCKN